MKALNLQDYRIYIGSDDDFWNRLQDVVAAAHRNIIVVDENTHRDCLPFLRQKVGGDITKEIITIPAGEQYKNISTCQNIWQQMIDLKLDRDTLVLNLGGGVLGDMAGFCAATFKRGLPFVQIPTTLLAQVDASIGGKLGIDFQNLKNNIGLFKNPNAVFICPDFLKTLPPKQIRSGYSEIIKHALIANANLWNDLQKIHISSDPFDWTDIIYRALLAKQAIVTQDPLEKDLRKILNFGHTIGHAIESYALQTSKPLLHGEAVAIGMICESWIAFAQKRLAKEQFFDINNYLRRQTNDYKISTETIPKLIAYMQQDKKNEKGKILFSLINRPGEAVYNIPVPEALIIESLHRYNTYQ